MAVRPGPGRARGLTRTTSPRTRGRGREGGRRKRAHEAAEEAEERAEETAEFAEKLAKRIEKGEEQRRKDTEEAIKDFYDRVEDYLELAQEGGGEPARSSRAARTPAPSPPTASPWPGPSAPAAARPAGATSSTPRWCPPSWTGCGRSWKASRPRPARKVIKRGQPEVRPRGLRARPHPHQRRLPAAGARLDGPGQRAAGAAAPARQVLEYRFVGRDLILRDTEANLIVDYILGAAPLRSGAVSAMRRAVPPPRFSLVLLAGPRPGPRPSPCPTRRVGPLRGHGRHRPRRAGAERDGRADGRRSTRKFPFTFVVMVGDNMYGADTPADYVTKFESPTRRCSTRA